MSYGELVTGEDFTAFRRTCIAAAEPDTLPALQRYYNSPGYVPATATRT